MNDNAFKQNSGGVAAGHATPVMKNPPREIIEAQTALTENNKKQQLFWSAEGLTKNNKNNTLNMMGLGTKIPSATLRNIL